VSASLHFIISWILIEPSQLFNFSNWQKTRWKPRRVPRVHMFGVRRTIFQLAAYTKINFCNDWAPIELIGAVYFRRAAIFTSEWLVNWSPTTPSSIDDKPGHLSWPLKYCLHNLFDQVYQLIRYMGMGIDIKKLNYILFYVHHRQNFYDCVVLVN
jgi:hypothetical protein